ncbi:SPOR domain-containing protein [Alloprevotella tannerae]
MFKEGGRFKYVTGIYATKAEAQAALKEVRKSFADAFIVKFNGDTHVP